MRYYQILNELRVIGDQADDLDGKRLIISRNGYVVVYDDPNDEELLDKVREAFDYIEDIDMIDSLYDLIGEEYATQLVNGHINAGMLVLSSTEEMGITSILNKEIGKAVKQLGLDGVTYEGTHVGDEEEYDIERRYHRSDVIDATVNTTKFYHGTSSEFLSSIMKTGIKPMPLTNFDKINHESLVFVCTNYVKALFHASTAVSKHGGVPVILQVEIKDASRLVLDYDIAVSRYGVDHPLTMALGYDVVHEKATQDSHFNFKKYDESDMEEWKKLIDKSSLNAKIGIFGFKGRIPANWIKVLMTDAEAIAMSEILGSDELSEFHKIDYSGLHHNMYRNMKDLQHDIDHYENMFKDEMDDEEDEDY